MIFSEIYGAYYNTVAKIIKEAVKRPLKKEELRSIVENTAFEESILSIIPSLEEERWQLMFSDGTTPIKNEPSMPLTTLQKRWTKAVLLDPRVRLFYDDLPEYSEIEPLFTEDDVCIFDKYSDGDPYDDEKYVNNFQIILEAIKKREPLSIDALNRKGNITHMVVMPDYLEYSEKDDKFRLIGSGCRYGGTVNLARIVKCKPYKKPFSFNPEKKEKPKSQMVEFELIDDRNALDRVLLHFAHFEKQAEKIDDNRYKISLSYDKDDETEMVIRILSFGPMIKVTQPHSFVELIKERLKKQKDCGF